LSCPGWRGSILDAEAAHGELVDLHLAEPGFAHIKPADGQRPDGERPDGERTDGDRPKGESPGSHSRDAYRRQRDRLERTGMGIAGRRAAQVRAQGQEGLEPQREKPAPA